MRAWWLAPAACVAAAWLYWAATDEPQAAVATGQAAQQAPSAAMAQATQASHAPRPASGSPFTPAAVAARQDQRLLWEQRLERAQATLAAYRESTRYPHESQPAAAHADQLHPNQPIEDETALRLPGGKAGDGVMLRTTQERVFVQGMETVRFTVSVRDQNGKVQPLRVLRASAHEVPAPRTASNYPDVPLSFNDQGQTGDLAAGDGVHTVQLQPATEGFAGLLGQIRIEVFLEYKGQQGHTYFDIMYTPSPPATWMGGVREALEDGSLNFYLKAQVQDAGRYVVTARVDDANGKPFALLTFNDELAAGVQEVKLSLYGRLVRDGKPSFPLRLRDVEAFMLLPDAFPDRRLLPRLQGSVHTSKSYPLASFSDAEWTSEERQRYLAELSRDVSEAQKRYDELGKKP